VPSDMVQLCNFGRGLRAVQACLSSAYCQRRSQYCSPQHHGGVRGRFQQSGHMSSARRGMPGPRARPSTAGAQSALRALTDQAKLRAGGAVRARH
jgi:hypothetical protein